MIKIKPLFFIFTLSSIVLCREDGFNGETMFESPVIHNPFFGYQQPVAWHHHTPAFKQRTLPHRADEQNLVQPFERGWTLNRESYTTPHFNIDTKQRYEDSNVAESYDDQKRNAVIESLVKRFKTALENSKQSQLHNQQPSQPTLRTSRFFDQPDPVHTAANNQNNHNKSTPEDKNLSLLVDHAVKLEIKENSSVKNLALPINEIEAVGVASEPNTKARSISRTPKQDSQRVESREASPEELAEIRERNRRRNEERRRKASSKSQNLI